MEQGEIILYQPDEAIKLEVRMENETVWLTQTQIAKNCIKRFPCDFSVLMNRLDSLFLVQYLNYTRNNEFLVI